MGGTGPVIQVNTSNITQSQAISNDIIKKVFDVSQLNNSYSNSNKKDKDNTKREGKVLVFAHPAPI